MKLTKEVLTLRKHAPAWANWVCVTSMGSGWWQAERGRDLQWRTCSRYEKFAPFGTFRMGAPYAIDLKTGDVHFYDVKTGKYTVGSSS